jgi:hypothetical protein
MICCAIARFICVDGLPFSTVDKVGFREMMKEAAPGVTIPGRTSLVEKFLPLVYEEEVSAVRAILAGVRHVAVSIDSWTSQARHTYLGITAHYAAAGSVHSVVLSLARLTVERDAKALAEVVTSTFEKWGIKDKICAIVADNEAVGSSAISSILSGKSVPTDGFHVRCAVHTLQLAVRKAMADVDLVGRISQWRSVVCAVQECSKLNDILEREAKARSIGQCKLVLDGTPPTICLWACWHCNPPSWSSWAA